MRNVQVTKIFSVEDKINTVKFGFCVHQRAGFNVDAGVADSFSTAFDVTNIKFTD